MAFDNAGDLVFDALEFDRECDLRFAAREGEDVIVCSWFVLLESESWSSKSSSSSSSLPFESLPPLPFDEPSKSEGTFFSYGSSSANRFSSLFESHDENSYSLLL